MISVLVLTQTYPSEKDKGHMFVHVRNMYYQKNGAEVTVLSFCTKEAYTYEGIQVISENEFKRIDKQYDVVVSHASNVRNSFRFLKIHDKAFKRIVFVFHGHEVLRLSFDYPPEFDFLKKESLITNLLQDLYDSFKFLVFRKYYVHVADKSYFVFVSNWLRQRFYSNLRLSSDDLRGHDYVVNNCVGEVFEKGEYEKFFKKEYDFITIRSNIDGSKYCVDIVNELALNYPEYRFLLIGRGDLFRYINKASNIVWIEDILDHKEMIEFINSSRFALMPTREDTQGLMACEMATFGIPTITSNIEVCREIFAPYPNVILIENDIKKIDLRAVIKRFKKPNSDHKYYIEAETLKKEWEIINNEQNSDS